MPDNKLGTRGGDKRSANVITSTTLHHHQSGVSSSKEFGKVLDTMFPSQPVHVASPQHGFLPGTLVDLQADAVTVTVKDPKSGKETRQKVDFSSVFPAQEDTSGSYEDNCELMYLNEATLLENVRRRWEKGEVYTYTASMLIALNPYSPSPSKYDSTMIARYQNKSLGTLPPHVFAIADKAFRDMRVGKRSQSIVVSGESGAGKTESGKYILRFLCSSSAAAGGEVERRILDANPILESFGNAKTTRNNNSSRFGKFIEIHFDAGNKVVGGFISHYLLEKSRIPHQSTSERSYHIFYQLLTSSASELAGLGLKPDPSAYSYLSSGTCAFFGKELRDPIVHDTNDFQTLKTSLLNLQIKNINEILETVAIVLHLGNLTFQEDQELTSKGGCLLLENDSLSHLVRLAKLEKDDLTRCLTNRLVQTMKAQKGGTVIQVPLKKYEAVQARDALAKAIYSRLFDYIVKRINEAIPFSKSKYYIGVLDIAGFEYFTVNSFEQFCINYCNEKLQQFFNERVLKDEQDLYEKEQLQVDKIDYVDNLDCIELIENRPGLLSLLDEEGKLPKPNYEHFTSEVFSKLGNHFRLELPRKSKIKEHRSLLDSQGFIVRHFAGAVCYETRHFVDKNNDALHFSLEALMQNSGSPFLQCLFKDVSEYTGKLSFVSVGSKFKSQLEDLLVKLRETGTSFVRCVKPNSKMVSGVWEGGLILSQLQCAGMGSVLELMQRGFPSRVHFQMLYQTYASLLPKNLQKLDPRFFARALFKAIGLNETDFRFGLTRVFFKPGKFKEFDMIMRSDPAELAKMIKAVEKWIVRSYWRRVGYCVLSSIKLKYKIIYRREHLIRMQKTVRMWLCQKKHGPRIDVAKKLGRILNEIEKSKTSVSKLKNSKDAVAAVESCRNEILASLKQIKSQPNLSKEELTKRGKLAEAALGSLLGKIQQAIQKEKNDEEARRIAEQIEREKKKKEEEERERLRLEEMKRQKEILEQNRKKAVALAAAEASLPNGQPEEEGKIQVDVEQEKLDNAMAMRLANMEGLSVEIGELKRSDMVTKMKSGKHDLSGWKYSELRDCINTSCDVELLNACREEFHRRLKVYHAWKAKNSQKTTEKGDSERAPKTLYQYQQSHKVTPTTPVSPPNQNRYFRVPFTKDGMNKGMWYAHFEGEFIRRQMEINGDQRKRFLAGKDDMQMCELKLSETGLTRKRGAEILEWEFEREWNKEGVDNNI